MNKFASIAIASLLLLSFSVVFANSTDEHSTYLFYLEYKDGVLSRSTDAKFAYDIIPGTYHGGSGMGDYYGEIVGVKKNKLATFWFTKPISSVPSRQKSPLEVSAPYFANADHVTFYSSNGASLFTLSLAGTSFCNDNGQCDAGIGENSSNCPNDCPPPLEIPQTIPAEILVSSIPAAGIVNQKIPPAPPLETPSNTRPDSGEVEKNPVSTPTNSVVIPITIGVFLILLSIIGWLFFKRKSAIDSF